MLCLKSKLTYFTTLFEQVDPYVRVFFDRRIPWDSRLLLGVAFGYLFSPIDIVPDVLPLIGQIDDVIVIAVLLYLARRRIPQDVREDYWDSSD